MGPQGCSQYVPVMGVTKRPAHVTSQGGVSAEVGVRASTLWAKHGIEPRLDLRRETIRLPSPVTLVRGAVM